MFKKKKRCSHNDLDLSISFGGMLKGMWIFFFFYQQNNLKGLKTSLFEGIRLYIILKQFEYDYIRKNNVRKDDVSSVVFHISIFFI